MKFKVPLVANCITVGLSLLLAAGQAGAQAFPDRPVRIIIGSTGGATEVAGRIIAAEMSKTIGQPVTVEPVIGAAGTIAAQAVAKAKPDGYTLYFGAVTGISSIFQKNNTVDAGKVYTPVSRLMSNPFVFYSSAKLPARNMQEIIAWSKANPGKLNFGWIGAANLLIGVALKQATGMDFVDVPYKSSTDVMTSLINGEIGLGPNPPTGWGPHIKAGTVRAVLVTSAKRFPVFPDTPTAAELGINGLTVNANYSLWGPLGMPGPVVQRLNKEAVAAVRNPSVAERLRSDTIGVEPEGHSPEELAKNFEEEFRFWSDLARAAKFTPQ